MNRSRGVVVFDNGKSFAATRLSRPFVDAKQFITRAVRDSSVVHFQLDDVVPSGDSYRNVSRRIPIWLLAVLGSTTVSVSIASVTLFRSGDSSITFWSCVIGATGGVVGCVIAMLLDNYLRESPPFSLQTSSIKECSCVPSLPQVSLWSLLPSLARSWRC